MSTLEETNPQPGDFIRIKYTHPDDSPAETTFYRGKVLEYISDDFIEIVYNDEHAVLYLSLNEDAFEVVDYVPTSKGQWVEVVTAGFTRVVWRDSEGKYMASPDSDYKTNHIEGLIHITPLVAQND